MVNISELEKEIGESVEAKVEYVKKPLTADDKRFYRLLHTVFYLCDLAGFHLENRLVLKDKKTGKIFD